MRVISYNKQQKLQQLEKRKKSSRKYYWIFGFCVLFLLGIVYISFFASIFDIREVKIGKLDNINSSQVQKIADTWLTKSIIFIKRNRNFILFNPKEISQLIKINILLADSVSVVRNGHTIEINISEREPVGVWCFSKKEVCYFFDSSGISYQLTNPTEGFIYAVVNDNRNRDVELGREVETKEWRNRIFMIREQMKQNGFEISSFDLTDDETGGFFINVLYKDDNKFKMMLSVSTDIVRQLNAFVNIYLKKMTSEERSQLEYADLRIPDRVYYK
jgi:cell division septal protein FtsQ